MKHLVLSIFALLLTLITTIVLSSCSSCEHEWTEANCTTASVCKLCDKVNGEPLSHTAIIDNAVSPSCTSDGLTEGNHCSICNEVLTPQETIPALGHTKIIDAAVAPTCTVSGLTEGKHCETCNEVIVAQTEALPLGHTEVIDKLVEPTCTTKGLTEGKHCSICNETLVQQKEIDTKEHNYIYTVTTYATCTENGYVTATCDCGATFNDNIPALGHYFEYGNCNNCGLKDPNYITYGRVHGQLTYQYNKFVGTRGDNGAKVMLIPMNDEVKNFDNHSAAMFLKGTYDSGIIVTKCDGYGNFDFGNSVPTGKYIFLGVSANATSGSRFNDEESWKQEVNDILGGSFSDSDLETLYSFLGYQDWCWDILTIEEGDSWEVTNDFGYTYI